MAGAPLPRSAWPARWDRLVRRERGWAGGGRLAIPLISCRVTDFARHASDLCTR